MSAHPAATPKANPLPPVISTTKSGKHGAAGNDTEPAPPATTPPSASPLEPHWEPVVSAATD